MRNHLFDQQVRRQQLEIRVNCISVSFPPSEEVLQLDVVVVVALEWRFELSARAVDVYNSRSYLVQVLFVIFAGIAAKNCQTHTFHFRCSVWVIKHLCDIPLCIAFMKLIGSICF